VRRGAMAYCRWCASHGVSLGEATSRVGLGLATVRRWQRRWSQDRLRVRPLGRPVASLDRELRRSLLSLFDLMGPRGLPALRELFPEASRSELQELQRWHARISRKGRRRMIRSLRWTRPGAVWAMDFSDPPTPIDGYFPRLLCIRDLASGYMLMALPCPDATTHSTLTALQAITRWNPVPLVIKCDNGSAFVSDEVQQWAETAGILLLYSPPGTPQYNGAIEAGIGSIKTRATWIAGRCDRPWHWTCDDIEAARCEANELARPRGPFGGAPQDAWCDRLPITGPERERFHRLYRTCYAQEKARSGWLEGIELQHAEQAAIDRVAITRALVEGGFLLFRRRRITLPIPFRKRRNIS